MRDQERRHSQIERRRNSKCLWKLARVIETIKGREEAIQSAKTNLLIGNQSVNLRRPIQHLVPVEELH